jgi:arginyl-tRNA synthetase
MNVFSDLRSVLSRELTALMDAGDLPSVAVPVFTIEPPRDPAHGDMATNIAMTLTKSMQMPPRAIAEKIKARLAAVPDILSAEIAGPGFLNLRLSPSFWQKQVKTILESGTQYGDCNLGQGEKINIEYVSANPTGPMHVGHVRGAVVGDALAHLLAKAGYDVTREYYFNDAGAQVDVLSRTTFLRYREALGEDIGTIPEGLYPGEYLKPVGEALAARDGRKWLATDESEWLVPIRNFAVAEIMKMIRDDLDLIGIHHDVFTNERELIENGTLEKAFQFLDQQGLIYTGTLPPPRGKEMQDWEPVPLILFRSSQFGDQTDRALKKRDGHWAYIMPDIAYHSDKFRRGFKRMINILGADHGGFLERMRPAIAALSNNQARLDVLFCQMVKVFNKGELVKLSKRSGNLITLREMVEQVGADAVRFFMLTRSPDTQLDFDFAKVTEQSRDNPVFYVQYAHARCCSVLRHAREAYPDMDLSDAALAGVDLSGLSSDEDLALIKHLSQWPRLVEAAAEAVEPHRIAFALYDFAASFHGFWNKGREDATLRFLIDDNLTLTKARLALVRAVAVVIASGLKVMGVTPAEELRG